MLWFVNMWRQLICLDLRKAKQWCNCFATADATVQLDTKQSCLVSSWTAVVELVNKLSFLFNMSYESFVNKQEIVKKVGFTPLTGSHN